MSPRRLFCREGLYALALLQTVVCPQIGIAVQERHPNEPSLAVVGPTNCGDQASRGQPMPSWLLKTTIHHVLKAFPHPEWWNGLMQRHVTRGLQLEPHGEFLGKLLACRRHLRNYLSYSTKPTDSFRQSRSALDGFPSFRSVCIFAAPKQC
jgi:hypothetical protein